MPQTALRQTVRERLASGWLFPAPHKVWAGKGTGHICIVCGTTIAPSEVENEVVGPTTVWSHLPCYSIWREESQTYERVSGADGSDSTGYLADLRQTVRNRFANGTLLALPHDRSWTGRGVSDICGVCSKPIFAAESSQEVIGVQRAHAHLVCYRAWLLESITSLAVHPALMAPRFTNFEERSTVVRIDRPDKPGVDLSTVEYLVTFGGAKDDVGAVIVARPNGFDALIALLRKLPIPPSEVETAIRVLTSQPSHAIQNVTLTRELLRSLRL